MGGKLNSQSPKLNQTQAGGFVMGGSVSPGSAAESYAFGTITRDHYYDVHGNRSDMPKNGSYHPRYSLVERYSKRDLCS